jgi:hypothetical protein
MQSASFVRKTWSAERIQAPLPSTTGEAKHRAGRDAHACFYFDMPLSEKRYEQLASGKLDWTVLHAEWIRRNAG